jgi:tRNA(His) 5'-end guanylyltransferase
MTAQNWFSHEKLQGVNTDQMQEMLWAEHKVNWDASPEGFKRGRVVAREPVVDDKFVTSCWRAKDAPRFEAKPGNWLADMIPEMPRFEG